MLGLMDPAILESRVPSSHLPAPRPPELDDHYRPGEVLKFLKIDFLDFLRHFPGGGERERGILSGDRKSRSVGPQGVRRSG